MGNLCSSQSEVAPTAIEVEPDEGPIGFFSPQKVIELRDFLVKRGFLIAKDAAKATIVAQKTLSDARKARAKAKKGSEVAMPQLSFLPGDLSADDLIEQMSAFDGSIVLTDPREKSNPLVWMSAEFEKLTGYAKFEILGKSCKFLQGNKTKRESLDQFAQLIQNNQEGIVRLLNYTAMGVPFENIVYVYPIQQGGKTVMWFGAQAASAIIEPTAKEIAQQQFESSKDKKKKKKKKSKGDDMEEVGPDPSKTISRQMSDEENLFPGSNVRVRSLTTTDNKPFGESHFANTEPVFFVSQYARGQVLVKTRGNPVMPSVAEFFQNSTSNVEIQIQFEMTKELSSDKNSEFYIGFEIREALASNWQYQIVNRILMACVNDARARRADPHICLGKYRLTSGASSAGSALSAASSNGYGRGDSTAGNRTKAGSRLVAHQSSGGLSNSSNSISNAPPSPVIPIKKQSTLPSSAVNPNALEYPHVVLPLGAFPDRLIVTSIPNRAAREHIPVLTLLSPLPSEPLPGAEEVTKVYEDGAGVRIVRAQTGNVYTMSISSSMLDLESWNLVRVPGVQQMSLAQVIGESFHLVCYTLGPPPVTINNSEQREHRLRDRTVLFDIEFSNSQN